MNPVLTMKSGSFLDDKQKEVKAKIMLELFDVLGSNLKANAEILDAQATTDIVFSCLIMFAREIIVDMILGTGNLEYQQSILAQFYHALASCVGTAIHNHVYNPDGEKH